MLFVEASTSTGRELPLADSNSGKVVSNLTSLPTSYFLGGSVAAIVPEPGTLAMVSLGFCVGFRRRMKLDM